MLPSGFASNQRQPNHKSQPGGYFAVGPLNYHRGQEHHHHKSRRVYDGCIPRNWPGVLGRSVLQPKAYRRAKEVERNRPAYIRIVPYRRRPRAHRQSSGRSGDCGNATPASDSTHPTTRVSGYSVLHVWTVARLSDHTLHSAAVIYAREVPASQRATIERLEKTIWTTRLGPDGPCSEKISSW